MSTVLAPNRHLVDETTGLRPGLLTTILAASAAFLRDILLDIRLINTSLGSFAARLCLLLQTRRLRYMFRVTGG